MASLKAKKVHFEDTPTIYPLQPEHKTEVQIGKSSSGKLRLAERVEEQNNEIVERWKEEVDSALVFAGLFSAIGAACLTESYKWSSRNPGKETVNLKLIAQLFQQLVNISDGVPTESVAAERSEPFKQTRSEVMVNLNVTWLFSVVICIGCAAFVTLIQQWARRHKALVLRSGRPHRFGRLQAFLFHEPGRFFVRIGRVYQLLGVFMRLSLLFYCVGLIALTFHIDQKSISNSLALEYILCSFLVYAITMVLPFCFFDCPYGTPFTVLTWRLYHVFVFGIFSTFLGIADLPHTLSTLGSLTYRRVRDPSQWRKMLEERVNRHRRRLLCGLERRVERYAPLVSRAVGATGKNSAKEDNDFTVWVLELFNTYGVSGAEETITLMSGQSTNNHNFGIRLRRLLDICVLLGTTPLTKVSQQPEHRVHLRIYLECLWCSVKAYNQKSAASLSTFLPIPNPDVIYRLQAEQDPTVAIMARCFCGLVAKEVAADINPRYSSYEPKLESLSAILGRARTEVEAFRLQPGAIGLTNIVSLTSAVMKALSTGEVSSKVLTMFRTTVDILLTEDLPNSLDTDLPQDLVSSFYQTYSNARQPQAPDWLWHQLFPISERLLVVSLERQRHGGGYIFLGQD